MENIRLVITDMDGCLLHDDKSLPNDLFQVIDDCFDNDIEFAVASGRSYFDLREQFSSKLEEMILICDNGALIYNKGKIIYRNEMEYENIDGIVGKLRTMTGSIPIYVTETDSYIEKGTVMESRAADLILKYYSDYHLIDDITELRENLCKITVCNASGTMEHAYPHLEEFAGDFKVVVSDFNWLDISAINVNKGNGVKHVRELLNIENRETVIFGDYLNDLEMFKVSQNAFAVANADPEILKLASRVVGSNQEDGVTTSIKEIIKIKSNLKS